MRICIYPLEKVEIDGSAISFGMERSAAESILGKGMSVGSRHYYFGGEMAVDYNEASRVDFVEFLGGIHGNLRPEICGISVFETPAAEVVSLLSEMNRGGADSIDGGYTLTFPNISIGLYRETRPQDVLEMIKEMKAHGIPVDGNEDIAEEERKANYWVAFGAGSEHYYRK